ncbi:MAG: apolipoprotein N-acyltransferase [Bacteroidales bacterium]|nr:apolipoprotein N-acyltransferase [Bacteroidales bacterium]
MPAICLKKMNERRTIAILPLLSAALMSIPWLVPHTGWVALFGLVPLLCAERIATGCHIRHFWRWYLLGFVVWNAATTFWIWNATAGGAVFAILYNSLQMFLVFGLFRISRRRFGGCLPYLFLMFAWIAWERIDYSAQLSWPWLTLGNAFSGTVSLVQWYSVTGALGGSLWVWAVNLSLFGLMTAFSEGSWWNRNYKAQMASLFGILVLVAGPIVASEIIYKGYEEKSEGTSRVVIAQPNIDVYNKFGAMTQAEQTETLLGLFPEESGEQLLLVAPETFTSDVVLNDIQSGATWRRFREFLQSRPNTDLLFGASSWEFINKRSQPSLLARPYGDGWIESHNSALIMDASGRTEVFHKSKLVVGVEKMPYPRIFAPVDDWLGGVMGRCVPQDRISCLHLADGTTFGCAVCYESVYGDYCTGYVREGAEFLTIITNDAWWGDTPGYRQHLRYASLRAIELRRDIARCANTGISAFINQRGDIVSSTSWWERRSLEGQVNYNSQLTVFARYGDVTGRVCTLAFILMLLALLVRTVSGGTRRASA